MKVKTLMSLLCLSNMLFLAGCLSAAEYNREVEQPEYLETGYPIVDTAVIDYYSDRKIISEPETGESYWGQDAQFQHNKPSYTDNGDGTITDNVTGLIWMQEMGKKMSYEEALAYTEKSEFAGYDDWRIPTIKELYSLILFTGRVKGEKAINFFIDTDYFDHPIGDTSKGEREIDAQTWSATEYVGKIMGKDDTIFGVNFVDGRIKGYPKYNPRTKKANKMYFRLVRGNTSYGINNYFDNGNGTVTDSATGLMWQKGDSRKSMDWEEALKYAEDLEQGGYDDWRLPDAKELQSIVDYSRSPQTSYSAAIDSVFAISEIKDPDGKINYPFFWTGTTHLDGAHPYSSAVYISFGEAQGKMRNRLMDVHGAGAQRSDPKSGDRDDYPQFHGPQGDIRYVYNYVRCVRTAD